jgi:hypothetical protein
VEQGDCPAVGVLAVEHGLAGEEADEPDRGDCPVICSSYLYMINDKREETGIYLCVTQLKLLLWT